MSPLSQSSGMLSAREAGPRAAAVGWLAPPGFPSWDDYWREVGVPEEELGGGPDRIRDPDGHGPRIWFQVVPEGKRSRTESTWTSMQAAGAPSRSTSANSGSKQTSAATNIPYRTQRSIMTVIFNRLPAARAKW